MVCATSAAVVVAAFATEVVHVAFHLPPLDTQRVAELVRALLIALPFAGLTALLQAWYAAGRDTRTPMIAGMISVGVFFLFGWPVMQHWGLPGLAWLSAGQYILTCALLLRRGQVAVRAVIPVVVTAAVAAVICGCIWLLSPWVDAPIVRLVLAAVAGLVAIAAGLALVPGIRTLAHASPAHSSVNPT